MCVTTGYTDSRQIESNSMLHYDIARKSSVLCMECSCLMYNHIPLVYPSKMLAIVCLKQRYIYWYTFYTCSIWSQMWDIIHQSICRFKSLICRIKSINHRIKSINRRIKSINRCIKPINHRIKLWFCIVNPLHQTVISFSQSVNLLFLSIASFCNVIS